VRMRSASCSLASVGFGAMLINLRGIWSGYCWPNQLAHQSAQAVAYTLTQTTQALKESLSENRP
jgi:hypothetical protein